MYYRARARRKSLTPPTPTYYAHTRAHPRCVGLAICLALLLFVFACLRFIQSTYLVHLFNPLIQSIQSIQSIHKLKSLFDIQRKGKENENKTCKVFESVIACCLS